MKKILFLALLAITVTTQSQINLLGQTTAKQESNFYVTSSLLTALAWTTDGYHLSRMIRNTTMIIGLTITLNEPLRKWYYYIIEGVIYYIVYTTGFNLSYDIIFK